MKGLTHRPTDAAGLAAGSLELAHRNGGGTIDCSSGNCAEQLSGARVHGNEVSLDVPHTSELTCEMNLYLRCDRPDVSCAEAAASCFFSCICCTCRSAQRMPMLQQDGHTDLNSLHAKRGRGPGDN